MSGTNFTNVSHLNEMIGNAKGNPDSVDWDALARQMQLIEEELRETKQAITNRDIQELRDGTADILVTTYGLAHRGGFDADRDMERVHASNMSKFCATNEECIKTGAKYEELGVQVNYRRQPNGMYAVVSAYNQIGRDGKEYPVGKLLKSINFKEPTFD